MGPGSDPLDNFAVGLFNERMRRFNAYCRCLYCPVHGGKGFVTGAMLDTGKPARDLMNIHVSGCCEAIEKVAALYVPCFFKDAFAVGAPEVVPR